MFFPINGNHSVSGYISVDGWFGTFDEELHSAEGRFHLENVVPTNGPIGVREVLNEGVLLMLFRSGGGSKPPDLPYHHLSQLHRLGEDLQRDCMPDSGG